VLTSNHSPRGTARANKVYVNTKSSFDGRSLDGFWLTYDPLENYSLFLLEQVLNASEMTDYYSVYDHEGNRVDPVCKVRQSKRI
jgi:hypothetical protein